jgi:hypothetical protein
MIPIHLSGHARLDALGWVQPMPIDSLEDFMAWGLAWDAVRQVADDRRGRMRLSTIFTGFLAHPFETMVFGPHRLARGGRWTAETRTDALALHGALLIQLATEEDPA